MSTSAPTLPSLDHLNVRYFAQPTSMFQIEERGDGTGLVKDLPIFRSGTFRDSLGRQHTWDQAQLEQLVYNYEILKGNNVFPNVPVRSDHSGSVDKLIGYVSGLRVDGHLLRADFEVTDAVGFGKIKSRTYRSVSAEVGVYETNDEAHYFPVLMGFAYVDIPAVEGLYSKYGSGKPYTGISDKETYEMSTTPPATPPAPEATTSTPPAEVTPPPAPAPQADHSRPTPHTFSIGGKPTTDYAAVQAHVIALEKFRADTEEASRKAYVSSLATSNKIGAAQVPSLTELALGLDDEQYTKFTASWDSAPAASLFGQHGGEGSNPPEPQTTPAQKELEDAEAVVTQLRKSGVPDEAIAKTDVFQRAAALRATIEK